MKMQHFLLFASFALAFLAPVANADVEQQVTIKSLETKKVEVRPRMRHGHRFLSE